MNDDSDDDLVIGIAFRRSLVFLAGFVVLLVTVFTARHFLREGETPVVEANIIAPQSPASEPQTAPPGVQFTDITTAAGISHTHRNGAYGDRLLPETMGGGVAFLDYNADGSADLFFVNGRSWPWRAETDPRSSLILYRGDGTGRFSEVDSSVMPDTSLYGMGAAVGDFDSDGFVDIFVTAVGSNRLFRNREGENFEDVTAIAGVAGADDAWSTGAAFFDYDRDGDLDLIVLNYVQWSREIDFEVDYRLTGIGRAYGPPTQYAGSYSYIYRNNGDGSFDDISDSAGLRISNLATGLPLGKGLAVLPADVNGDGWTDLVVANDTVQNFLFLNRQGSHFEEVGVEMGIAFDNNGAATGAMGIDDVVFGQSRDRAIAIGNFANEMTSFFVRRDGARLFTDEAIVAGIGPSSRQALTFGLLFLDYDLDGRVDLLQANGHVENDIDVVQPSQHYAQPPQLFWHCGVTCPRQFVPVELSPTNDLSKPLVGRGASAADIDNDGDLDIVMTQIAAAPVLLRNDQATDHNWIQFDVLDRAGAPAHGAVVEILAGDRRQQRRVEPTRSYLSQVATTVSFGLGTAAQIDSATIRWADGSNTNLQNLPINRRHVVRAGQTR